MFSDEVVEEVGSESDHREEQMEREDSILTVFDRLPWVGIKIGKL